MRTLVVTAVMLMSFGLHPLFAQDQQKPPPGASQPAQTQGQSNGPAKQDPELNEGQKQRMMDRMGPGIDWDHRKAGRDWQITPGRESGDVNRERE
jgi:hypothetical protein